jgi:triacylglycerol lipase
MSKPAAAKPSGGIYAPLHEKEPYAGVKLARDVKYGQHERQALDVFEPAQSSAPRPVFIYVHGGGYTGGHKRIGNDFFFDNVMLWAVRNGMVGVNATYRLAPDHAWPAGPEDIGAVVRWVRANIGKHGGDPNRIFLAGHSAGGTHVATYATASQFHAGADHGLRGLLLISGNFDISAVTNPDERYVSYFGADTSKYAERSPFAGLLRTEIPLFVAYAELDPPPLFDQSARLVAALRDAKRPAHVVELPNHSHISITYSINSGDTELSGSILDFIGKNR